MEEIGKEKTAIFLVVPDEKTTYHFLAALLISQCYESLLDQADACRRETRSFLDRLYGGSLGLMVSTLVGTEALTPDDVEELEELLRKAKEAKRHDESQ